jgi:tetratricopeptide (TPR) repeat protein
MKRAVQLDPLSSATQWAFAACYWMARRYDQAIVQCEKTLEFDPDFGWAHGMLAWAYLGKTMPEAAIAAAHKAVQLLPGSTLALAALGEAYAAAGHREAAQNLLDQLEELSRKQYVPPYMLGRFYVGLGKKDQALDLLEMGCKQRASLSVYLKIDPSL